MIMMTRTRVIISGFVQGVGFRHGTKNKAQELGLVGWVSNTPDSKVEAVFEGEKEKIEKILNWCNKGPWLAEIERVDVVWEEATGEFSSFKIK